ncbi:ribonuclease III [Beutenbergia cavernae DSM 12333]|uniref:Ribonuclease 3 n=1 Tax=Beutenbergia cavernae (strain ATCC BAA-8 / DSM 12333 / CCUG 43141 / JCM 11478 / NBRC 16432 / NCIMB 13614 / HKI 0122) TaxID=471853 RepID=C5C3G6_BEUC1|nr:ribonuclease III [Beutenbergia cavernae]ACQ79865.1 ribonuclease III [Beutenbergia cavernae DSM 12333]
MARSRRVEPPRPRVDSLAAVEERLGVGIDPELAVLAFTHRSFAHEAGGIPTNERLEFLGDSVLGVVITDHLFRSRPDSSEGELAKMRAACVSQRALAVVARELRLGEHLLLGKGESATGGRDKDSILSDTLEAVIGAVYLTNGLEVVRDVLLRLLGPSLAVAAELGAGLDWKTSLQELSAELGLGAPLYDVDGVGPDHDRRFTAHVVIAERVWGSGTGSAKKHAEQEAARTAYAALREYAAASAAASSAADS